MFLLRSFILPGLVTFLVGLGMTAFAGRADRQREDMRPTESFVIVALIWLIVAFSGSLPYLLSGTLTNFIDAYFETMSGFSTTGASVIIDVDGVQKSVLFWRALTCWLGGIGIVVLIVAFFSMFIGGYRAGMLLMKGEVTGHSNDKLVPRLKETGKYLFYVYCIFTLLGITLLSILGMPVFDAICHTFTSLATAGFANHTEGIYYYRNLSTYIPIQLALCLIMLIGATSFVLHFNLIFKQRLKNYFKSPEFRVFFSILIIVACLITINLALNKNYGPWESLLNSFFTVVSLNSTTGHTTEDFGRWPLFSQFLLLLVMIFGGMTGSTCGALKTARLMVVYKAISRSLLRIGHPKAVNSISLSGLIIPEKIVKTIGMFVFGYILILIIGTFLLTITGLDFVTSFSGAVTTLGGVGPGLNLIGPWSNYASLSGAAKIILTVLMWLGRLELVTGIVLFLPSTYRK